MEDSVPTRKRGRPRKITSIDADRLRSMNGVCRCGTLMQAKQGPRSVWEYTEEFMETAKRCKPKLTEDWCRWYKAGLREEIQGKLLGVLEPWEFALVNRMAGQVMKAERALTVGSSPSRALRRKWMWKMICGRHRLWMKEPREDVPSCASARLRRDIRGELNGAMESMEFALVVRMAGKAMAAKAWLLNRSRSRSRLRLIDHIASECTYCLRTLNELAAMIMMSDDYWLKICFFGTSNGTHGDVRNVDMCVLNPVPRNPGRIWEGAGVTIGIRAKLRSLNTNLRDQRFPPLFITSLMVLLDPSYSVSKESSISSKASAGIGTTNKSSNYDVVEF
ncbi:hypothetical protein F2Q70_00029264 [Brassica cretica]|uniref:Retrotransposon gag domain-containing protein n=1 Tax=Brassica cretica TaxID=69181 RepID=A0A8S9FFI5_BRACR|nr:hypothetical protein F2Q70_00029264 [Brassica cretica]